MAIDMQQNPWSRWLLVLVAGLVLLVFAKDSLEAALEGYAFYWSESLLFGSFWLLFIPLLSLNGWVAYYKEPRLYLVYALVFSLLHLLLFASIVTIFSNLFMDHPFGMGDVLRGSGPENGAIALLIYGLGNFFFRMFREQRAKASRLSSANNSIRVTKSGRHIVLSPSTVLYVCTDAPYISITTTQGTYLHSCSLQSFMDSYGGQQFVRIHKSSIVNTEYVKSYVSRGNGDYDVTLQDGTELRLSRNYAKEFFRKFS
ncbi:LytR/AlgR family response regulator transcription factor [Zeaxanthinibacter enoshimensis]|uniref:LytTr DNA-binding domain-containing protein n=1 Tax=Zeaxanthinibacter enoshimensis TaxID=392009 RepID=A0A4R6TPB8_9FLAO|nr:LytTR family DNA-binding domain-containing protein [Zeaxanthinibacter enoshimensis]TDQ33135.1 LytTr DNA-binding domain-containing protein [Zeaxanthinibacter enoshimensis]